MKYQSSRGQYCCETGAEAIKMGLSPDGGLFVPETIPLIDRQELIALGKVDYKQRACSILANYLNDFSTAEISDCVNRAYGDGKFNHPDIAPMYSLENRLHIQELWHGPTCAFKDMALQILPHLLTTSMEKTGERNQILILVATSGDTGKAALEGFRDVPGTRIIVFYPEEGVSEVQKRQMITQEGNNVFVAAVQGNFDDAQNGVKDIFSDSWVADLLLKRGYKLSSANSINWGRLVPQIVYYISGYLDLVEQRKIQMDEAINVAVPTGNFGNILAAYYAKRMGIPINKLICASNTNNILTDFIRTGTYNRERQFYKTISPSMDILISSNLERLLFELSDRNSERVGTWMKNLKEAGLYAVDETTRSRIQQLFWADYCTDAETMETIASTWKEYKYLVDTHTAVGINVYRKYVDQTGDNTATIIASTASPYKFGGSVVQALLGDRAQGLSEFEALNVLEQYSGVPIPSAIKGLEAKSVLFNTSAERDKMGSIVLSSLE